MTMLPKAIPARASLGNGWRHLDPGRGIFEWGFFTVRAGPIVQMASLNRATSQGCNSIAILYGDLKHRIPFVKNAAGGVGVHDL
jgi:hypothetical protein